MNSHEVTLMESEEFEQIPWSNLVAEVKPPVDRRIYLVAGGVGVVVLLILGMRTLGSAGAPAIESQPAPTIAPVAEVAVDPVVPSTIGASVVTPVGPVSEADLLALGGADSDDDRLELAGFTAEWFVTDFYTRDGSPATLASLREMMSQPSDDDLPHLDDESGDAFVEWARAFRVDDNDATVDVSVAYRAVHAVPDGYVRDPVAAVVVTLALEDGQWTVQALPVRTDLP